MRKNVIWPAKQFILQYGDEAYAKAREAQLTALKERRGHLAAFYGKVAEKINELSARYPLHNAMPHLATDFLDVKPNRIVERD